MLCLSIWKQKPPFPPPRMALSFVRVHECNISSPAPLIQLHENTCKVVPRNEYIEVGSDTEVVCQTSCIPGKIYWTLNKRRMDESQSSTVNSSHAVLSLRNFTLQNATLQCLSADTLQALGGTIIRTYCKNFISFEDYSPDLFTCNWEHQIKPSPYINYTVLMWVSGSLSHESQHEICKSRITNCRTTSERISLIDNMTITVRAEAAAWEAVSDPREFCPDHILKMIRPKLTLKTSSDHVLVSVSARSRAAFLKQCRCEVKYRKWVRNNTLKGGHGNETIEEFDSCSNYTFSVRCALVEAPWSDWSENKTVLTKLNSESNLRLWRKVAEPEENGVRKVHAMWTTSTLEGNILVSWKASIEPVTGYMIDWTHGGNQYFWKESNGTDTTLSGLPDEQPYNVTVTPLFDGKTGHGTQALQICSRPGNVMIQVQAKDRSALVSWNVTDQGPCSGVVVTYTVFYSVQKGPQLNVTVNGTERFISLKDLVPDTQYSVHVNATALTGTTRSHETLFKTKRFGEYSAAISQESGGMTLNGVTTALTELGVECATVLCQTFVSLCWVIGVEQHTPTAATTHNITVKMSQSIT
uniref:Fibronectin type-III domain-containing protein n=1 Tax=Cyclopterus lumpus TaxID=8103 RepID=A0A8C2Z9S4_CYCLU